VSAFQNLIDEVSSLKCPTCSGLGEYDDAGFGDIFFNTYRCTACKGTGFRDGQSRQLAPVSVGSEDSVRSTLPDGVSGMPVREVPGDLHQAVPVRR
jgi:DnaJ-class molecular chaperone